MHPTFLVPPLFSKLAICWNFRGCRRSHACWQYTEDPLKIKKDQGDKRNLLFVVFSEVELLWKGYLPINSVGCLVGSPVSSQSFRYGRGATGKVWVGPSDSTPRYVPKRILNLHTKTYTWMFVVMFFVVSRNNPSVYRIISRWTKIRWTLQWEITEA